MSQQRTLSPFDLRSVMLFAAMALGGTLAQAQTGGTSAVSAGQSTAPHTTNTQSAVSSDKQANGSAVIGPASSSTGTMNSSAGQGADVNNRSNVPHATPGKATSKHKSTTKSHTKQGSVTSNDAQGRANTPHSTPGAPQTDPSPSGAR